MRLTIYRLMQVIKNGSMLQLITLYNEDPILQQVGFTKVKAIYYQRITNYHHLKQLLIGQPQLFTNNKE